MRKIEEMSDTEIGYALAEDGYNNLNLESLCRRFRRAAKEGCLLWTQKHIISTQSGNNFELLPERPNLSDEREAEEVQHENDVSVSD